MTSDSGNIDARAESIRNLRMAETELSQAGKGSIARAVRIELHCRIASVWSDLAYGEEFRQGLGTPDPSEAVSGAYSDSAIQMMLPVVGDRFKDRHDDMWTVIEMRHDGTPVLLMGDLQDSKFAARYTWDQVREFWGPVTPWTGAVPDRCRESGGPKSPPVTETAPEPAQTPTTAPRTYTHEGVEYVYGVRYTDCEDDGWVIVDTLADGTPLAVPQHEALTWCKDRSHEVTMITVPTLVLRYGPLEMDRLYADARG